MSYGNENARVPCGFCHVKNSKRQPEKEGDLLAAVGMRIASRRQGWRAFVAEEIA